MLIAINRADGGVSIMRILAKATDQGGEPALHDIEAEIAKWSAAQAGTHTYASHHAVTEADIPTDRTFRNAWISDGKVIIHDMEKCRAIHRDRMRTARAPKLAALDIEYQRADETGDKKAKAAVAALKQQLRDITRDPRIDAAKTPKQLKAVWPSILG